MEKYVNVVHLASLVITRHFFSSSAYIPLTGRLGWKTKMQLDIKSIKMFLDVTHKQTCDSSHLVWVSSKSQVIFLGQVTGCVESTSKSLVKASQVPSQVLPAVSPIYLACSKSMTVNWMCILINDIQWNKQTNLCHHVFNFQVDSQVIYFLSSQVISHQNRYSAHWRNYYRMKLFLWFT